MAVGQDSDQSAHSVTGNDKLLVGLICAVLGFWLFAQTILSIGPVMAGDLGIASNVMNIAVSITTLFGGIFVVRCLSSVSILSWQDHRWSWHCKPLSLVTSLRRARQS